MNAIGRRLKDERTRRGLSQEDLAALAKISTLTIIRIEQGKSKPRLETVRKLAGALSLPAESLAFGTSATTSAHDDGDKMNIQEVQTIASHIAASSRDILGRLQTLESLDTLPAKEKAKVQRALKRQEAHVQKMDRWNASIAQAARKAQ